MWFFMRLMTAFGLIAITQRFLPTTLYVASAIVILRSRRAIRPGVWSWAILLQLPSTWMLVLGLGLLALARTKFARETDTYLGTRLLLIPVVTYCAGVFLLPLL
jgi:hypothetical protein